MGQIKTLEELLAMKATELLEYLISLPLAERQRISRELLKAKEAMEEQEGELNEPARK